MNPTELCKAVEDLRGRSLASLPGRFGKLVSLSAVRDYNTGVYSHDGLAFRFTRPVAEEALRSVHQEVFRELAVSSLEAVVQDIDSFIQSTREEPGTVLATWRELQPYRMLIPKQCDPLLRDLFFSNVRMALAVLEHRQPQASHQNQ